MLSLIIVNSVLSGFFCQIINNTCLWTVFICSLLSNIHIYLVELFNCCNCHAMCPICIFQ